MVTASTVSPAEYNNKPHDFIHPASGCRASEDRLPKLKQRPSFPESVCLLRYFPWQVHQPTVVPGRQTFFCKNCTVRGLFGP